MILDSYKDRKQKWTDDNEKKRMFASDMFTEMQINLNQQKCRFFVSQ